MLYCYVMFIFSCLLSLWLTYFIVVCSFFFFYKIRAVLAEYSGAVLGVLSAVLHGRRGFVWKKVWFNLHLYS